MVPPVLKVGKALHHLRFCRAKGVLVAPKWPSSHFWPLLINDFSRYISNVRIFKGNRVLTHGLNKNSLLGADYFQEILLLLLLTVVIVFDYFSPTFEFEIL